MARRKSGLASLAEGFNAGYDTVGKVVQDFRLANVENTKPEDTGYSKPGGEINAPDPEKYAYDPDTGTYVPKTMAGGAEIPEDQRAPMLENRTPEFGRGERVNQWSLNGKTFNEQPTDQQIATEKTKMRAGVYRGMGNDKEADALEANALSREAAGLTIDKARREADADAAGRAAFEASPLGAASKQYRESIANYQKAGGKNPDGSPMELPQMPTLTAGDHLQTAVNVALATRNPDMIGRALDMQKKVRDEGMPRAMTLLNAGAPKEVLARAFSETGAVKVDPANLSDPRPATVEISPGVVRKTWEITHTDPRTGQQTTYNALRELDAYGKAKEIIDRDLAERKVRVSERTAEALANTRQQNADTRSNDQLAKELGLYGAGSKGTGAGGKSAGGEFKKEVYDRIDESLANAAGALPADKQSPLGTWMRDPNNPMAQSKFHVNPTAQAVAVSLAKASPDLMNNTGALANATAEVLAKPRTVDRWTGQEAVEYDGATIPIPGARKMAVPSVVQKIAGDQRRDAIVAKVSEAVNMGDGPTLRKWSEALGVSNAQLLDLANHFQSPAEFTRVAGAKPSAQPPVTRSVQGRITPATAGLR